MKTLLSVDQAVLLAMVVGMLIGLAGGLYAAKTQITKYKLRQERHYTRLINLAMKNAYNAGRIDGENAGKTRPSKVAK